MPPERNGPRRDGPASPLRFDKATTSTGADRRGGASWKKTAARMSEPTEPRSAESVPQAQAVSVETEAGPVYAPLPWDAAYNTDAQEERSAVNTENAGPEAIPRGETAPLPTSGQTVPKSVLRQESIRFEAAFEHSAAERGLRHASNRAASAADRRDMRRDEAGHDGQPQWKKRAGDEVRQNETSRNSPASKFREQSQRAEAVSEHSVSDDVYRQESKWAEADAPAASRQEPQSAAPRQWKKQATAEVRQTTSRQKASDPKFRQESSQPKASDRLHHEGGARATTHDKPPGPGDKLHKEYRRMERRGDKLERAQGKLAKQKPPKPPGPIKQTASFARRGVHNYVHGKIYEVEHENVGVEAAHRTELVGEAVGRGAVRFANNRIRTHPARVVRRAESRYIKATADYHFKQTVLEHPEMKRKPLSRLWRKRRLRKQYAKQAREAAKRSARAAEKTTEKVAVTAGKLLARAVDYVKSHPVAALLVVLCILIVMLFQSCATSMTAITEGITGSVAATTYPAEDADLLGAEAAYTGMESDLKARLDDYENTHEYDEYSFDLDAIEHDPYVLLSIVSALHPDGWTLGGVQGDLRALFDRQYTLTEDVVTETRYRTETQTKTREAIDPDTGAVTTEEYEEEVEVPYDYTICTVTLDNFNLSHLPVYIMGEEQLSRYSLYMAALGNRPDLFPASAYVLKYGSGVAGYTIPPEALSDEKFAAMIKEAEKYLGYPYVWGGSSPATSFDCSGFVCWVINNCGVGWNVGRLGSDALYFNVCTPVSPSEAKPGDLIFFQKTYDTPYTSHVGIYVGNGMMIHCGDPIRYVSIQTDYWQSHFYGFGRLP